MRFDITLCTGVSFASDIQAPIDNAGLYQLVLSGQGISPMVPCGIVAACAKAFSRRFWAARAERAVTLWSDDVCVKSCIRRVGENYLSKISAGLGLVHCTKVTPSDFKGTHWICMSYKLEMQNFTLRFAKHLPKRTRSGESPSPETCVYALGLLFCRTRFGLRSSRRLNCPDAPTCGRCTDRPFR